MAGSISFKLKNQETTKNAFELQDRTEAAIKRARKIAQQRGISFPAHVGGGGAGNWHAYLCWSRNVVRDVLLESIGQDPKLEISTQP